MKNLFTILICLTLGSSLSAQTVVAEWNSTNGTGSMNVTAGTAVLGAGLNPTGVSACGMKVFTTNQIWDIGNPDPTTAISAVSDNEYIEFPITAASGYKIYITSVTLEVQSSATGGREIGLYNGTSSLGFNTSITGTNCSSYTINLSPGFKIAEGTTANIRLYVWGAQGPNNSGSWRVGTVKFYGNVVLPVQFHSFNADLKGRSTALSFSTATETDNDYFTIERSADGRAFDAIGKIQGAGNSAVKQSYSFTDENPLPGVNYYRIKQTDYNGSYTYTGVKSVRHRISNSIVTPGKTDGILFVTSDLNSYDVVVYNTAGQEVQRNKSLSGDQNFSIENLQPGIYFVRILDQTFKVLKY